MVPQEEPNLNPFLGSLRKEMGRIGFCDVCRNKAELEFVDGDPRAMCGDCAHAIRRGMSKKLGENKIDYPVSNDRVLEVNHTDEKKLYLSVIKSKADPSFIEKTISELVSKKVLFFDFSRIIENDRWFTILDLRRMALELDPGFEDDNHRHGEEKNKEDNLTCLTTKLKKPSLAEKAKKTQKRLQHEEKKTKNQILSPLQAIKD